ncbi:MAG TPA: NAD-dependent epimerase/dehydratase family protein [bacterium]|nr:NAD-dependent epimerase/dehydratase family protein [bacterium]
MSPKKQTIKKNSLTPTILISGGAGFIGSHVSEHLLGNNARVIVLDNYSTGKDIYINHLLNNPNFAFYNVDINHGIPQDIESVDYVIHLAGLEEYLYSKEYINLDSLLTNSIGIKNLLDLAKISEAKFLLVSTIDVYQGKMSQLDIQKYFGNTSLEENKYSLTEAKRFSEALLWEYFKKHNLDSRVVRLPEVYGPRMNLDASGSLGTYLKSVIEGRDLLVYGDGYSKEYYLYISDAVLGISKALFGPDTKGNIYSLIPENPISSLELAYLVRKMADGEINVQFKEGLPEIFSVYRNPDIYTLKNLDWKSRIDLKQGIAKTLEWFGYTANQNSFKPNKYVEDRIKEKTKDTPKNIQNTPIPKKNSIDQLTNNTDRPDLSWGGNTVKDNSMASKESVSELSSSANDNTKSIEGKIENLKKAALSNDIYPINEIKTPDIKYSPVRTNNIREKKKIGNSISFFKNIKFPSLVIKKPSFNFFTYGIGMKIGAVIFSAFLIFVCYPLISTALSAKGGISSLEKTKEAVKKADSEKALNEIKSASEKLNSAKKSLSMSEWMFRLFGYSKTYLSFRDLMGSLYYFSLAGESIGSSIEPAEKILEVLRPDTESTLEQISVDQISLNIKEAQKWIGLAEAQLKSVYSDNLPKSIRERIPEYNKYLEEVKNTLDTASILSVNMPEILGSKEEKNYIVWFQNSNEIRPTGGFIGSYGILKLDKGKLKEVVIDDIYNPDGQIMLRNINAEPPAPIREFLQEERVYLRNSNWNPDFPKAVSEFDDLYFKVNGIKIDGYIAMDLYFVKDILQVTGPIYLAAYNEEISADNLYERAQFHSDFNYQDGSDQKRSFLTVLGSKLMEKMFLLPKDKLTELSNSLNKSLEERHLSLYLVNNEFNAFLKEKKWDGSLVSTDRDYLYVVNANLGGTKANYYVKNKMNYTVNSMTRDGLLRASLTLDYEHSGKDMAWPGGPYKDYVRVLTQEGSKLTGARIINGSGEEVDIFKDIIISQEGKYNSFETSFILNPQESVKIIIEYDLPQTLSITEDNKYYELYWQKQPGTNEDEFSFIFNLPFGMTPMQYSPILTNENNVLKKSGFLNTDLNYFITPQ